MFYLTKPQRRWRRQYPRFGFRRPAVQPVILGTFSFPVGGISESRFPIQTSVLAGRWKIVPYIVGGVSRAARRIK